MIICFGTINWYISFLADTLEQKLWMFEWSENFVQWVLKCKLPLLTCQIFNEYFPLLKLWNDFLHSPIYQTPKVRSMYSNFPIQLAVSSQKQPTILGAGKKLIFREAISIANEITSERPVQNHLNDAYECVKFTLYWLFSWEETDISNDFQILTYSSPVSKSPGFVRQLNESILFSEI